MALAGTDWFSRVLTKLLFWDIWLCVLFCLPPGIYQSKLKKPPKKSMSEQKTHNWCSVTRKDRSPCRCTRYRSHRRLASDKTMYTAALIFRFMSPSGSTVFPLRDLQDPWRAAGQKFLPSSCGTNLLSSRALSCRITRERSGALLWLGLEKQSDCFCSYTQICKETATGEHQNIRCFF